MCVSTHRPHTHNPHTHTDPADAATTSADTAPPPLPRPHRACGARPHATIVADSVAAVRSLVPSVSSSPAWRRLRARLDEASADADEAGGGKGTCWSLDRTTTIALLGLGHIAAPGPPRAQAAMALLLVDAVTAVRGDAPAVVVADPVLDLADVNVVTALGWTVAPPADALASVRAVLADDETACVLAYLPHCDPPVVEGLLEAVWTPGSLPRVALIGNSVTSLLPKWEGGRPRGVTACSDVHAPPPTRCLALATLAAAHGDSVVVEAAVAGPTPAAGDAHGAAFNDTVVVVVGKWDTSLDGVC